MKKAINKFLKLDLTVKLSLLVSLLLIAAIGLTIGNALKVQNNRSSAQNGLAGTPVCEPKPACLDAAIPCLVNEPEGGWCSEEDVRGESTYYVTPTLYCIGSCQVTLTPTVAPTSIVMPTCPAGTVPVGQTNTQPPVWVCATPTPTQAPIPTNTLAPTRTPTPTRAPTATRAPTPTKTPVPTQIPSPTKAPTPTCTQLPSCMDNNPPCQPAVPPGGWCPKPTSKITPKPTKIITPVPTKCVQPILIPSVTPVPGGDSAIDGLLDMIKKLIDLLCQNFGICNIAVPSINPVPTGAPAPKLEAELRIEAGGNKDYTDSNNRLWIKDRGFVGGSVVDRGNIRIQNTRNPRIYQTERWGMSGANYDAVNGDYRIRMHFAETYSGVKRPGQRVFDVEVNGVKISNLDVFARARGRNKPLVITRNIKVTDGKVKIKFTAKKGAPEINGIELLKVLPVCDVSLTPTVNPSVSPVPSISITPSATVSPTIVISNTPMPTASATPTIQPTQEPTSTPVPTATPTAVIPTPTPTSAITPTEQPTPTLFATNTPTIEPTDTPAPTDEITPTEQPTPTATPTGDNNQLIAILIQLINAILELLKNLIPGNR